MQFVKKSRPSKIHKGPEYLMNFSEKNPFIKTEKMHPQI